MNFFRCILIVSFFLGLICLPYTSTAIEGKSLDNDAIIEVSYVVLNSDVNILELIYRIENVSDEDIFLDAKSIGLHSPIRPRLSFYDNPPDIYEVPLDLLRKNIHFVEEFGAIKSSGKVRLEPKIAIFLREPLSLYYELDHSRSYYALDHFSYWIGSGYFYEQYNLEIDVVNSINIERFSKMLDFREVMRKADGVRLESGREN